MAESSAPLRLPVEGTPLPLVGKVNAGNGATEIRSVFQSEELVAGGSAALPAHNSGRASYYYNPVKSSL